MKFLLLSLVALFVIWALKRGRKTPPPEQKPPSATAPESPAEMVSCVHCSLHLPQAEAVSGQKGLYCSTEHRAAAQDHHPL